jgi:uncharacterized protein involved in exopolysaccharide biosynthesis/Mrp family chromosome partitioning ATPase
VQKTIQLEGFPEKNLRDIYYVVFRHKWKIVWFFITVVALVAIISVLSPKIYRSEGELLIKIGRESVGLSPTVEPNKIVEMAAGAQRENELNSELAILKNRELIGKVVDTTGVDAVLKGYDKETGGQGITQTVVSLPGKLVSLPFEGISKLLSFFDSEETRKLKKREKAIDKLLDNFEAETIKRSNTITVAYEAKSPGMAQKVVSTLISLYLEKHIQAHRTEGSYQFFENQKKRLYEALAKTGDELRELRNKTKIGSLETQKDLVMKRIGYLKREIESTDAELAVSGAMVTTMQQELAGLPHSVIKEEVTGGALSAPDEMLKRVNELQLKENELRATFTEDSIPVLEAKRQVAEAKGVLKKTEESREIRRGINDTRQRIELNLLTEESVLASLKAKDEALKAQLTQAEEELNTINNVEQRMKQLELDNTIQQASYQKYSESFEQSLIDQALDLVKISNISIVQPATYPIKHVRPRVLLNLMLGILLGLFGGLGLAFISESLDHSIGKPEDIERTLEIPALGAIASLYPEGASPQEKASMALPVRFDSSLPFMKDFEAVAERLLMGVKLQAETQRVFSITSCHKGAGVSTVAAYLASSLARHSDGRVLLVDVNFQDPFVHQIFDISLSPGLADLSGGAYSQTSVIQSSPVNKLDVLCAGKTSMASDKRIFESKGFADLLKYWKHEYSFVLIDTPAVWEENYVVTLANMVDGVIMVFEAEEDRWEVAQRAKDRLAVGGATLVGGILNKRLFYVPKWLYQRL